ncbi:MAG TPA: ABC transporter permease [Candidatus Acidoferrales bacterium]|nr:ABC transporter permease [Candidatus Acidoferrales bacterium]
MPRIRELLARFGGLFRRAEREREMEDELRSHLELAVAENLRRGMTAGEARRAALVSLGGMEQAREVWREQRGLPWLEVLARDLRYGLRLLARSPGFTAIAIATLALGIGANTAIFAVTESVLLRPLPYPSPNRLAFVREFFTGGGPMSFSMPDFEDLLHQNHTFEQIAVFQGYHGVLTGNGEPALVRGALVSAPLLSLLGAKTALGRGFTAGDDHPGAPASVVLGYGFWRSRLGGGTIVGRALVLDGKPYTVIGVLAPDFPYLLWSPDLYLPIGLWAATPALTSRGNHGSLSAVGRLRPGVSFAAARDDLDSIMARLASQYPATNHDHRAFVEPLSLQLLGDNARALWILLVATGLVLLIACANLANLELVRGSARPREFAIRAALGAGRRRIFAQLLTESLILALAGGAMGLVLAAVAIGPLLHLAPQDVRGFGSGEIPRLMATGIDRGVLFFNFLIAIVAGILCCLAPALQSSKLGLAHTLQESGRATSSRSRERLRSALLVGEMAVAAMLAVATGLMLRSLVRAETADPGFDPNRLLALDVVMVGPRYHSGSAALVSAAEARLVDESLARLRALPGVVSAGATLCPPLVGDCWDYFYSIPGRPASAIRAEDAEFNLADPGYFRALRAPLVAGREFTDADTAASEPVAIINQAMARMWWPQSSPIGEQLRYGEPGGKGKLFRIVGVVADVRQDGLDVPQTPEAFFPLAQMTQGAVVFVARTEGDPSALATAATGAIHAGDPELPVRVHPMTDYVAASLARRKFITLLLGLFGALAVGLAMLGVYGVVSFGVAQRTQEIGVRLALGAAPGDVLLEVVQGGARLAVVGVAIGFAGALASTRAIAGLLYGVGASDPATFAAAGLGLLAVALGACWIPARRAARVDPLRALRFE